MKLSIYQCDVCSRNYPEKDVYLLYLNYSKPDSISLKEVVDGWFAGVRCICKHCVSIISNVKKASEASHENSSKL